MKGIEKLNLSNDKKKLLDKSEISFKRFARIYFEVLRCNGIEVVVKVWQLDNPAKKYLSAKELIDRTKGVFSGIVPDDLKINCRTVPYEPNDLRSLTIDDVKKDLDHFGLKPKDLVKLLDIDKSSLSLILSENRELSKANRAMFYYLIKYLTVSFNEKHAFSGLNHAHNFI